VSYHPAASKARAPFQYVGGKLTSDDDFNLGVDEADDGYDGHSTDPALAAGSLRASARSQRAGCYRERSSPNSRLALPPPEARADVHVTVR
jgi:hypothetical protein